MEKPSIAKASATIDAPIARVWDALVNPATIRRYMFGTDVTTDWKEGSPIRWKGEWKGKAYEDKGILRQVKPRQLLEYSHFSPLSGLPDRPDSYHNVRIQLAERGAQTELSLTQDNNPTDEARAHSEKNWGAMLEGLKKVLEEKGG
jgi:uncharacterized protein YndB with AHSA1/START domain